ncbi:MAG: hypothetical protein ACFCUM_14365 [Bacteroidales bacterium]
MKLYRRLLLVLIKKEIFPGISILEVLLQLLIVLIILFMVIAR